MDRQKPAIQKNQFKATTRSRISKAVLLFSIMFHAGTLLSAVDDYKTDPILVQVREHLGRLEISQGRTLLDKILSTDSLNREANYLRAELYLLYGDTGYRACIKRLETMGAVRELMILDIKEALITGDMNAGTLIAEGLQKYPDNGELLFAKWVIELDRVGIDETAAMAKQLSEATLFKPLPYQALLYYAIDRDPSLALAYLDTLETVAGVVYHSRNRSLFELKERLAGNSPGAGEHELEYADCGPGMGFYMVDAMGNKIKVELDTGTSNGLFTIHNDSIGREMAGSDTLTITDGIWYNYMPGPEDMHYKLANFTNPPVQPFLVGYFKGTLSKADGCFSPFAFEGYAITIDPIRRQASLRDKNALDKYVSKLSNHTSVNYITRGGWIYIPCKINGEEVLMMVETGSRDVNLNKISAQRFGIKPYQGSIEWRGNEYPVEKVDFLLEIGELKYEVKGGLISDFVLGNTYYGLGSAGDIGPDFFRNFSFTIDPFNKRLIIEERRQQ